jgi:hypothetical protein
LVQAPAAYGALQSASWNGVLPVYEKIEGGEGLGAIVIFIMHFEHYENRFQFFFRKAGDDWEILSLPELFPSERPAKGASQ